MSEWKKVKIGEFLTEREGRFKPDDKGFPNISDWIKSTFLEIFIYQTNPQKQI
jgi:hypothetical protein